MRKSLFAAEYTQTADAAESFVCKVWVEGVVILTLGLVSSSEGTFTSAVSSCSVLLSPAVLFVLAGVLEFVAGTGGASAALQVN